MRIVRYKAPGKCPICNHELIVSKLTCQFCPTTLEGEFSPCKFCQLPTEQREFIQVFIRCRGNIKDVEKELKVSYPTVRNRLDSVITALGYPVDHSIEEIDPKVNPEEVLEALEQGEITAAQATKILKENPRKGGR